MKIYDFVEKFEDINGSIFPYIPDGDELTDGEKSLFSAIEKEDITLVKSLINSGIDMNTIIDNNRIPLRLAIKKNNYNLVYELLKLGSEVNKNKQSYESTLGMACYSSNSKIVDLLINQGAVKRDYEDLIDNAILGNNLEVLEFLLSKGFKMSTKSLKRWDTVIRNGNPLMLKYLIDNGCEIQARNDRGESIISKAALYGKLEIVKYLIQCGADVDYTLGYTQYTALHNASINGHLEIVKFLVESGANVNMSSLDRWTPLHIACIKNNQEISRYLILKGANKYKEDVYGKTPIDWANENGFKL